MVRRLFVEKKEEFAVESKKLLADIRQNLNIQGLKTLSVINRYDIEGGDQDLYTKAKSMVFAELTVDNVYEETLPIRENQREIVIEYLPGQFNQRGNSAEQCIELIKPGAEVKVAQAKVIVLSGNISDIELNKIKAYLINPVDSREGIDKKPESLKTNMDVPEDVEIVKGFLTMSDGQLKEYAQIMGFAMSHEDIKHIHSHFTRVEMREPTVTELKVLDTYWSDHCRHTTFNIELTDIYFEESTYGNIVKEAFAEYMDMRKEVYGEKKKPVSLMDMACIGAKYLRKQGKAEDLDLSEEINACSIKVKAEIDGKVEDWLVMFKNETHNHPTEIEPFGGAATCLGGAIRDPLSGRVYVHQAMRVTGSADPRADIKDTLKGKLPQKKISKEAALGYSSYGNQIGLATGQVSEIYHPGYLAKRMEVGAVIGAARADQVIRKKPEAGDIVILLGGRTGRDGCGGATGSSKGHTQESINNCGAEVQKGNPPIERNIQRLFRRAEVSKLIKRCNDFGAGGVSVAIGELADGLDINLDLVPKKYEGLDGTEIAISESQERMAVVVSPADEELFKEYAISENLEATRVALVTDKNRISMTWKGKEILNLDRDFLNSNGAKQYKTVKVKKQGSMRTISENSKASLEEYLDDLNCCSQKGLVEQFDSTIGAATVLMPLGGRYQLSPTMGMVSKLPVTSGSTETSTSMTFGYDPYISEASPYHGAMAAVIDSVTKIVALGGEYKKTYLSFQEYFEKLKEETSWGKPMAALLGALKVQRELEIPAIGGKDSMSGSFMDINVPPTLISFAVSTLDAGDAVSTEWKKAGSKIVLIRSKWGEKGDFDFAGYKRSMDIITGLIKRKKVLSACALGRGGIFAGLVKMAVGNKIGCNIRIGGKEAREENHNIADLLGTNGYGSMILEIPKKEKEEELLASCDYQLLGTTTEQKNIKISYNMPRQKAKQETHDKGASSWEIKEWKMSIQDIINRWTKPLEEIFPVDIGRNSELSKSQEEEILDISKLDTSHRIKTLTAREGFGGENKRQKIASMGKPRVLIPVFPGTNCEMDTKKAFDQAGAETEIFVIQSLREDLLRESMNILEKKLRKSQILMLPGGFSGGDEPDGSAKFITAIFRNPQIQEATSHMLNQNDGLILGICNGFQALIKLGLVPYGSIKDITKNDPTLTFNQIGRHQSMMVNTKIASRLSPWLMGTELGAVYKIPVSHGEGRFVCEEVLLQQLIDKGQIATQYVDFNGNPSMSISHNPNGSVMAIEGITSPDGKIFGKMGHSERIGNNLYKNIIGKKDMKIFQSGVDYFK